MVNKRNKKFQKKKKASWSFKYKNQSKQRNIQNIQKYCWKMKKLIKKYYHQN